MTREELRQSYYKVTNEVGQATRGTIYCDNQLIAEVAHTLCAYSECNIIFEDGAWNVSPHSYLAAHYAPDRRYVGKVRSDEWYTPEQIRALHEVAFGYQF